MKTKTDMQTIENLKSEGRHPNKKIIIAKHLVNTLYLTFFSKVNLSIIIWYFCFWLLFNHSLKSAFYWANPPQRTSLKILPASDSVALVGPHSRRPRIDLYWSVSTSSICNSHSSLEHAFQIQVNIHFHFLTMMIVQFHSFCIYSNSFKEQQSIDLSQFWLA